MKSVNGGLDYWAGTPDWPWNDPSLLAVATLASAFIHMTLYVHIQLHTANAQSVLFVERVSL